MGLKVQRQDNLDKLFDKFAIGPDDPDKLTTKSIQKTIDDHAKQKAEQSSKNQQPKK
ncbi:SPJ_0845 family protein [Lactiplantibacillus modestisalitolerans]|uniref:SPJ_0845 family protein n=1 Tax=Lactiplantibacillus modestisalitolerans TaxID=1457219 RepID=A0ABV5WTQ3_9LACO|nr:SPJ_0845 family protein [Lactiplantibacillus modestisalitolerans]